MSFKERFPQCRLVLVNTYYYYYSNTTSFPAAKRLFSPLAISDSWWIFIWKQLQYSLYIYTTEVFICTYLFGFYTNGFYRAHSCVWKHFENAICLICISTVLVLSISTNSKTSLTTRVYDINIQDGIWISTIKLRISVLRKISASCCIRDGFTCFFGSHQYQEKGMCPGLKL